MIEHRPLQPFGPDAPVYAARRDALELAALVRRPCVDGNVLKVDFAKCRAARSIVNLAAREVRLTPDQVWTLACNATDYVPNDSGDLTLVIKAMDAVEVDDRRRLEDIWSSAAGRLFVLLEEAI